MNLAFAAVLYFGALWALDNAFDFTTKESRWFAVGMTLFIMGHIAQSH